MCKKYLRDLTYSSKPKYLTSWCFENITLLYHLRAHTGEKAFECSLCDKSVACNVHLKRNMKKHIWENTYHCCYSNKNFSVNDSLITHMSTHTGERPCKCNHSDKSLPSYDELLEHVKIVIEEKPYHCNFCDKAFIKKQSLVKLCTTHTGEKHIIVANVTRLSYWISVPNSSDLLYSGDTI